MLSSTPFSLIFLLMCRDFSTFLDTAEDIHRNCLVLINHEAVQSIQGSNASVSAIISGLVMLSF